jgi:hypothetical protein
MPAYLVTYDLRQPGRDYASLWSALAGMGAHRVLLSVWVVQTGLEAEQIRNTLQRQMDPNDAIIVARLEGEAAWGNAMDSDWLKRVLASIHG